jgi:hypothetical protein
VVPFSSAAVGNFHSALDMRISAGRLVSMSGSSRASMLSTRQVSSYFEVLAPQREGSRSTEGFISAIRPFSPDNSSQLRRLG